MLSQIVLVLQFLRSGFYLRIYELTAVGHPGHLFEHYRIVHSLERIFAPSEGTVIFAKAAGYGDRILPETPFTSWFSHS